MKLLQDEGCSFIECGAPAYDAPPLEPQNLMRDDAQPEGWVHVALVQSQSARQTVRLMQCRACSKILSSPVTLPCGHTVCRGCLPFPQLRQHISYPNTPDRQLAIACPLCAVNHPTGDCGVDVAMSKILDGVRAEINHQQPQTADTPSQGMEDVQSRPMDLSESRVDHEMKPEQSSPTYAPGSLLVPLFKLAEAGQLDFSSDVDHDGIYWTEYAWGQGDESLLPRLNDSVLKELDCLVCYNLMLEPTTTGCGHTFCRRCLARGLDHSNICPICRRPLQVSRSLDGQPCNERLSAIINTLYPDLVRARVTALTDEEQVASGVYDTPLFVCTLSLPTMPTFLYIFEPRYRLMIRRCLNGNRQFGMVMVNRSGVPQGDIGVPRFVEYGTLLQIINFELLEDGRSCIETRGISRFRVKGYKELDGYFVGNVERVDDVSLTQEEQLEAQETQAARAHLEQLRTRVSESNIPFQDKLAALSTQELLSKAYSFVSQMRQTPASWLTSRILDTYGEPPNDAALFPYWFAGVLPISDEEKYMLLRTTRVRERLFIVNMWIHRIRGQRWSSGSACTIL